jgi:hypothetical protein
MADMLGTGDGGAIGGLGLVPEIGVLMGTLVILEPSSRSRHARQAPSGTPVNSPGSFLFRPAGTPAFPPDHFNQNSANAPWLFDLLGEVRQIRLELLGL